MPPCGPPVGGDRFTGEILSVSKDEIYVSTSSPLDAVIAAKELRDESGQVSVKPGDRIEVVVTQVREDSIKVKPAQSRSGTDEIDNLEDAYDMELPLRAVLNPSKVASACKFKVTAPFAPSVRWIWGRPTMPMTTSGRSLSFSSPRLTKAIATLWSQEKSFCN
ncbi:MAG: S1 RNA-binding domain-containing protein [Bdellovibrionaceae bacterium]|nr:S1 RNA-binding domain-containing protein [Pseudobdellovibrionaceae bacterium]